MQTFLADKPKLLKRVIIEYSLAITFLVALYFLSPLFLSRVNYLLYYVLLGITLIRLVVELYKKRIVEISFDMDKNLLLVKSKKLLSSERVERTVLLNQIRIEIDRHKPFLGREHVALYFLKEKFELFEVNFLKDGYSSNKLINVTETAKNLSIPIKKY